MSEKKVLGILATVFGGIALAFSWVPIINNMSALLGLVGAILGVIGLFINRKNKKTLAIIGTVLSIVSIVIVLMTQSAYSRSLDKVSETIDKTVSSSASSSESDENASSKKTTKDASRNKWTYKNDVFSAGILTYKFTKSEVQDAGMGDNSKVLVLFTNITNNSDKEQTPSNIYAVMHAYQKTDTANKDLNPGMAPMDDNAKVALQKESDALNDKLLPGKTTKAVIIFTLENTDKVTVTFDNANFNKIGSKVYNVK